MDDRLQAVYAALTAALAQAERTLEDLDAEPEGGYDLDDIVTLRTQAEELVTRLQRLEARLTSEGTEA